MAKTKERHPRQPLNYQSLGVSCWVTSVMNALLVLKKEKERIPVLANRLLLSVLSEEGVEDNEAEVIIRAISDLCSLAKEVIKSEKDIINRVTNIEDNEVVIADTGSGEHSILILGRRKNDNWLKVFDPDDVNVAFSELCGLVKRLGFSCRIKGDHHIFWRDGIEEILNFQPKGTKAKAYQVGQVRDVILKYRLNLGDES